MDAGREKAHRLTNALQSLLLVGGMGLLLLLLGYTLGGAVGAWLAAGIGRGWRVRRRSTTCRRE
jgi:hypothetical protein